MIRLTAVVETTVAVIRLMAVPAVTDLSSVGSLVRWMVVVAVKASAVLMIELVAVLGWAGGSAHSQSLTPCQLCVRTIT